jgi:hypothetical protein
MSARIFFRSSTVEFLEITNLYSASNKVNLDSARDEDNEADLMPSESLEYSADPESETTPRESRTVERITFVASDCESVLRMLLIKR